MTSITPLASASYIKAEADRRAAAVAQAHDAGAVAMAELCRQARGHLYQAIASARHGLVLEECAQAINCEELARTLLQAMQADGEISEYQGIYSATFQGAA